MIDGVAVTFAYILNKICVICSMTVIVMAVILSDVPALVAIILAVLVLIRAYTEKRIADNYIKRYGGDSTWADRQ